MCPSESFAEKVSSETPWWATAPIWLAAGIVGVPSLLAIGAGFFIAQSVTKALGAINQMEQSQLYLQNEHMNEAKRNFASMLKFVDDDLRCQFQNCINSGKTPAERAACVSPRAREQEYGIVPPK